MKKAFDINGKIVKVGSIVKLLKLNKKDFSDLDDLEFKRVLSMVGDTYKVYEVDEYEQAWITKEWWESEDEVTSHSIALASDEMELIDE